MENINQTDQFQVSNNPPKKSKAKKIIMIVIILLIIGGAVSYFMPGKFGFMNKIKISSNTDLAAAVNGEEITKSEFEARVNQIKDLALSQKVDLTADKIKEIQTATLDEMINERILFQDAKKKGVVASAAEIDKTYNEIIAGFKTKEDFTKELAAKNLTDQSFKDSIVRQLTLIKYIGQSIDAKNITASEKEVADLYAKYSSNSDQKNMPKLADIKIQLENEIKQGKSRAKILELINKLKEGVKIEKFII